MRKGSGLPDARRIVGLVNANHLSTLDNGSLSPARLDAPLTGSDLQGYPLHTRTGVQIVSISAVDLVNLMLNLLLQNKLSEIQFHRVISGKIVPF